MSPMRPRTGSPSDTYRTCQTCWRPRPAEEFTMPLDREGEACHVKLCRVILWENPDDPYEGWPS
jgi:hypothetical protein